MVQRVCVYLLYCTGLVGLLPPCPCSAEHVASFLWLLLLLKLVLLQHCGLAGRGLVAWPAVQSGCPQGSISPPP